MSTDALKQAIEQVATTQDLFALDSQVINGVTFRTFKNGPKNLSDVLDIGLQHGDADFLVFEDERYTFHQFHQMTRQLAAVLQERYGVRPGDRVALLMRNCPEYPMLFMALAILNAVPVFLNSWWTTQELAYGFGDCEAKLAFVDEPRAANVEPFADELGIRLTVVRTSDMQKVAEFWSLFQPDIPALSSASEISPDSDFGIMYTSGSSGHPKGVVLTHRSAVAAVHQWLFGAQVATLLGFAPAPTIDADGHAYQPCTMMTTPFFHISATHAGFLLSLWMGMKLIILRKWDPMLAVDLIEQEKVSRFACVPTMSAELMAAAAAKGIALDSLRTIDSGGAKRPKAQLADITNQVPHVLPGTGWGMTETGGPGIGMRGELYLENPEAAGRLQPPLLELRIVDEQDNVVEVGEVGELTVKGVSNMRCYLNKPDETRQALREGWLYTGDLAKIDEYGMVTIVDRKKDMIIRGGENISCSEVNAALHMHPAVAEGVVFSIPDDRLGEDVGACVFLRSDARATQDELRTFLKSCLALYKIPKRIWIRETPLPRGATEKIDVRKIKAEYVTCMTTGAFPDKSTQVQGYDIPVVEAWIKKNTQGLTPPFAWTRLEGGHSNLTYLLQDESGNKAVIRRPPLGKLLPKAHDMRREWALISSLGPTGFPVPAAIGFCDDKTVTGADFYLMGYSPGRPLHSAEQTQAWVPADKRVTLAHSFIDTLALLHSLDPDEIGLGTLGKKEDYVGRQVKTWYRSWLSSVEPAKYDDPRAHELRQYFLDHKPEQGTARVVHGDYGFHNCLIGAQSTVTAVVDWEISTLGDPLADLAYTLKGWPETEADIASSPGAPTSVGGFPFRQELAQRYAETTGLNIDMLEFYVGFNHWKSAAILHGVYARYLEGKKSTKGVDLDLLLKRIEAALAAAVAAIDRVKSSRA